VVSISLASVFSVISVVNSVVRASAYPVIMPVEFKHARLPNGLDVVAEINPDAHTAAAGFFVKTGARDEDSRLMGVSHFLEHMMFKGTESRSAEEVDRDFDDIGADHNAFTTAEMTAFHAHCLPEHLPRAQEVLSDILRPVIRAADFDAEKSVILEEIAMYNDYPFWQLYERALETFYASHPLRHRVLGTNESVGDLKRDEMLAYFTHRYSADNTVFAAAGRIDFDAMLAQLRRECGSWNTTRASRSATTAICARDRFAMQSDKVKRHYTIMLAPAPDQNDDRRYAAAMLAQILGDGEGSRLHWALIEPGLADEAQSQYDGKDHAGEFVMYASCSPDAAGEVEGVILKEIDGLVASLTDDDLERTRSKIATGVTLHGELPAGRMTRLGRMWLTRGEYKPLEEELARINAVTRRDLREVAAAYPMQPWVTGTLSPE
jgi:predicted Zn-dependent peptidase